MNPLTKNELLEILEATSLSQLRAVRALRRAQNQKPAAADPERKSNMEIVIDILTAAKGPLHVTDILQRAKQDYRRQLSRESLVSALTKKVLDQNTYGRTAPNTFDLLSRPL